MAATAVLPLLLMVAPAAVLDEGSGSTTPAVFDRVDVDPTSLPCPPAW